jgi:hypothetical protein
LDNLIHVSGNHYKYKIPSNIGTLPTGTLTPPVTTANQFAIEVQFVLESDIYDIINNINPVEHGKVEVKNQGSKTGGSIIDKFYNADAGQPTGIGEFSWNYSDSGVHTDDVFLVVTPDAGYEPDLETAVFTYWPKVLGATEWLTAEATSIKIDWQMAKDEGWYKPLGDGAFYLQIGALPESNIKISDLKFKLKESWTVTADETTKASATIEIDPTKIFIDDAIDKEVTFTITPNPSYSLKGTPKILGDGVTDITSSVNLTDKGSGSYTFDFPVPGRNIVISAAFQAKVPDRNDPNDAAWKEPKGGFLTVWDGIDYAPVQNINNPITDNFSLAGGGGVVNEAGTAVNLNDSTHHTYKLGGGGGADDDKDGILNINDPDALAYYLLGGAGYVAPGETPTPSASLLPGDVNSDGEVTLVDAQLVLKLIVGLADPSDVNLLNIWALFGFETSQYSLNVAASQILKIVVGLV